MGRPKTSATCAVTLTARVAESGQVPVSVTVFEPNLTVNKQITVKPQLIGDTVTYTVTFLNQPGPFAVNAFDRIC